MLRMCKEHFPVEDYLFIEIHYKPKGAKKGGYSEFRRQVARRNATVQIINNKIHCNKSNNRGSHCSLQVKKKGQ